MLLNKHELTKDTGHFKGAKVPEPAVFINRRALQVGGGQSEGGVERDAGTVQGGVRLLLGHRLVHDAGVREHSDGGGRLPQRPLDRLRRHHQQIQRLQGPRASSHLLPTAFNHHYVLTVL